MKWIEANGAVFRTRLTGQGQRTIVLIHEAGGSIESWDAVAPALSASFRVLCYDQRGFGMSECTSRITQEGMVDDLAALLAALDVPLAGITLVGSAIGGSIALAMAARFSGQIGGVVATSPVTGGLSEVAKKFLLERADRVDRDGLRGVIDGSLDRSYPSALRNDPGRFQDYRCRVLANDPRSFAALSRAFTEIELAGLYHRILCPTLIVGCSDDSIKPAEECREMALSLVRGQFVELPSGHFVSQMAPDRLIAEITQFMEGPHERK